MNKRYDRDNTPVAPQIFQTRHDLQEWVYLHIYNMLADDSTHENAPSVFDAELIRGVSRETATDMANQYNYIWFAIEGLTIGERVELLNTAYVLALKKLVSATKIEKYTYSRQM